MVIVGAGPAGATAAIYARRANLRVVMIDKAHLGGALGITARIANWPGTGYDRPLSGAELLRQMHEHAITFGAEFVQTQVYTLNLADDIKEVYTAEGAFRGRTVLLATGAGSRKNKLPGEDKFLGRGVSYCATCDAAFYRGRTVAVLGSSHEAVEEALTLAKFAGAVHVFCPTAKFFAEQDEVDQLMVHPAVKLHYRYSPLAIEGERAVEAVRLSGPGGEVEFLADGVFVYLPGNRPATDFLEGHVKLDKNGFIVTKADLQTSQSGVFAAGDVRGNPVQQVVIAAADGCLAALAVDKYINKRARAASQR
jgi:thioredoxin reductase (NADPH)